MVKSRACTKYVSSFHGYFWLDENGITNIKLEDQKCLFPETGIDYEWNKRAMQASEALLYSETGKLESWT